MKIGIDIDNVLTELQPTIEYMAGYFDKEVPSLDMIKDYNLGNVFNTTPEEDMDFWQTEELYLIENAEFAKTRYENILKQFIFGKDEIFIITNRNEKYREATRNWLFDNGIKYDHLIMTNGEDKCITLLVNGIDYMIDDKPDLFFNMNEYHKMNGSFSNSGFAARIPQMIVVDYAYNKDVPCKYRLDKNGLVMGFVMDVVRNVVD